VWVLYGARSPAGRTDQGAEYRIPMRWDRGGGDAWRAKNRYRLATKNVANAHIGAQINTLLFPVLNACRPRFQTQKAIKMASDLERIRIVLESPQQA